MWKGIVIARDLLTTMKMAPTTVLTRWHSRWNSRMKTTRFTLHTAILTLIQIFSNIWWTLNNVRKSQSFANLEFCVDRWQGTTFIVSQSLHHPRLKSEGKRWIKFHFLWITGILKESLVSLEKESHRLNSKSSSRRISKFLHDEGIHGFHHWRFNDCQKSPRRFYIQTCSNAKPGWCHCWQHSIVAIRKRSESTVWDFEQWSLSVDLEYKSFD